MITFYDSLLPDGNGSPFVRYREILMTLLKFTKAIFRKGFYFRFGRAIHRSNQDKKDCGRVAAFTLGCLARGRGIMLPVRADVTDALIEEIDARTEEHFYLILLTKRIDPHFEDAPAWLIAKFKQFNEEEYARITDARYSTEANRLRAITQRHPRSSRRRSTPEAVV